MAFKQLTVICSVLFSADQRLGVEQRAIDTGANFVNNTRFEINVQRSGDVFSGASLGKESAKTVVARGWGVIDEPAVGLQS